MARLLFVSLALVVLGGATAGSTVDAEGPTAFPATALVHVSLTKLGCLLSRGIQDADVWWASIGA